MTVQECIRIALATAGLGDEFLQEPPLRPGQVVYYEIGSDGRAAEIRPRKRVESRVVERRALPPGETRAE